MPPLSKKQILQRGVSEADLDFAEQIQAAQRTAGGRVQTLAQICGITHDPQRNRGKTVQLGSQFDLDEITRKSLRGVRNHAGAAAVHMRVQALQAEDTPQRDDWRRIAEEAERLAGGVQLEFDFSIWKGNSVTAHQYLDAMIERLDQLQKDGYEWKAGRKMTDANRFLCMAVLQVIGRHLEWQGPRCQVTASQIAVTLNADKVEVSRAVKALEAIGAVETGPAPHDRRQRIILVTPHGIYRGSLGNNGTHHTAAVEDFEKERARIRAAKADKAQLDIEEAIASRR
jgi:DNA-binding MarR family transcriptional regulator